MVNKFLDAKPRIVLSPPITMPSSSVLLSNGLLNVTSLALDQGLRSCKKFAEFSASPAKSKMTSKEETFFKVGKNSGSV